MRKEHMSLKRDEETAKTKVDAPVNFYQRAELPPLVKTYKQSGKYWEVLQRIDFKAKCLRNMRRNTGWLKLIQTTEI